MSATTSMSASAFNDAERPILTMKWSSTTMIRIGFELCMPGLAWIRSSLHLNRSTTSGIAVNLQAATERLGSLAHIQQSEVAAGVQSRFDDFEAGAIIIDLQANLIERVAQPDNDRLCTGVFERVHHRFLSD